jgi:putative colanic acid biosysnthesis UDP-glucose lipid carrier transferase
LGESTLTVAHGEAETVSKSDFLRELYSRAALSNRSHLKRAFDVLGAVAGLGVLGPFLILVALLIRLESPGPALFRQRRTGRGGAVFDIYKFRSMTVCEDGPDLTQATKGDARLTRLGAFLRHSCIDELPQLLNVLSGEMSLVGPRPHAIAHDVFYATCIDSYGDRLLVRPGIAGLAQVSGLRGATPTVGAMAARVELDRKYIACWSFALDLRILVRAMTDGPFHPSAF